MATQLGRQPGRAAPGDAVLYKDSTTPGSLGAAPASVGVDSQGRLAVQAIEGGGLQFNRFTYPTGGHGGNSAADNPSAPTLIDLNALGVAKALWFPGVNGTSPTVYTNVASVPGATLSGNDGSGNALPLTLDMHIITNELDPIGGQSTYIVLSKPSCFTVQFDETLTPTVKVTDSALHQQTATATASFATKSEVYLRIHVLPSGPGSGTGAATVMFLSSGDGGLTFSQFGDLVTMSNNAPITSYSTTVGNPVGGTPLGITVGGGTYAFAFRGAVLKAVLAAGGTVQTDGTVTGFTVAATLDPGAVVGTAPASWTGPQGETWTLSRPQGSNWVTSSCLASSGTGNPGGGNNEYVTLNDSSQLATTAGLYPTLSATGFLWDAGVSDCVEGYRNSNSLKNIAATPVLSSFELRANEDGVPVFVISGGIPPIIEASS